MLKGSKQLLVLHGLVLTTRFHRKYFNRKMQLYNAREQTRLQLKPDPTY